MKKKTVWTPGLTFDEVSREVEDLRARYETLQSIPIDIDAFLEFDLGLEIVPLAGLREKVNAEAMISQDYKTIYVDVQSYNDERLWNRLKFSIAHELGHMFLHKDFFCHQDIKNEDEWINFMSSLQLKYSFLENHANWFAGMLLIPASELRRLLQADRKPSLPELTRHFEVSTKAICKRLASQDMTDMIKSLKTV